MESLYDVGSELSDVENGQLCPFRYLKRIEGQQVGSSNQTPLKRWDQVRIRSSREVGQSGEEVGH